MATARTRSLCHWGDEVSTPHAADGQEEETAKEARILARERERERVIINGWKGLADGMNEWVTVFVIFKEKAELKALGM